MFVIGKLLKKETGQKIVVWPEKWVDEFSNDWTYPYLRLLSATTAATPKYLIRPYVQGVVAA